jgi:hypothetical protein
MVALDVGSSKTIKSERFSIITLETRAIKKKHNQIEKPKPG